MMRRLAIALAVVGGLLVLGVLVLVLNLNRLAEGNRDRIVAGVSAGFARPVQIDRITTGFQGGIAIALEGLHVAEDPAFGQGDFIAADRTYVVVRLPALLRGRIEIRRIVVEAPRLTVVRTANGMSIDSLGRRPDTPAPAPRPASPREPSVPATIPAFAIALLELEDGIIQYVDRTKATPVETTIAPLDVRLSDLSLTDAMRIEIDAEATGAATGTVRVRGTVGPIGDPPFAAEVPVEQHVTIHGTTIDVADLAVTGRLRRTERGTPIATLRITAPALSAGDVELSALEVTATERDGVATLERMAFGVFGGTVVGNARVDHTGATPTFAAETHVRGVDVARALAVRSPDLAARFEGRLDADCAVSGSTGDEAIVRRTLTGMGHAAVRNGRLVGVNVADGVLSGVTGVGGLVTLVPARVRDRYPAIFASDDTTFDELSSDVRVADQRIVLESLAVTARDYAVRAKGTVAFTQQVDLTGTLTASAPLTADVIGGLKQAKILTDTTGRLAIPFRLVGVAPNVRPQPDAEFVGRVLRKALADEGLDLDRLLGGRHGRKHADGKGRHDTNDAIKRELDRLFR
jgi:hypothetical protein